MTDTGWKKTPTNRKDQFGNPVKNVARRLARQGMQSAIKDLKKGPEAGKRQVEDVEEIDELSKSTLASYAKKATHDARIKHGIGKDFERVGAKTRKPEYKAGAKKWEDMYKSDARRREAGVGKAIDRLAKEEVELDEALRHEIAGAVGQFIGNKIDPVHGDIMRVHGKEAYRQAAFHIRKTVNDVKDAVSALHDRLHKQLRTGGLATEEVEELDELKRSTLASYTSKAADQMANAAIDKSTGAAMGTMGRMSDMPDLAKKGSDKEDKAFSTILKRTKGITSASKKLAKEDSDVISKYTKLGEAKYPGFRVRMTSGGPKLPRRGYGYVPQGDQDPRTGMPLGFSPAKEEPKKSEPPKKTK